MSDRIENGTVRTLVVAALASLISGGTGAAGGAALGNRSVIERLDRIEQGQIRFEEQVKGLPDRVRELELLVAALREREKQR